MTTQQLPPTSQPYRDHVADYALAGWTCVLPVPADAKFPPPVGFTGAEGRDTDPMTIVDLATRFPSHAVALRLPIGVVGIDVDQYEKKGKQKHGAQTLAALEASLGPLPATWSSTARGSSAGPGTSRVMLFRVPPARYATALKAQSPGGVTGDIEILQHHHRYAVVWPSVHSETGTPYTWYDPAGRPSTRVPSPGQLTELPPAWVQHLAAGATDQAAASADVNAGQALLDQLLDDHRPECAEITNARLLAAAELTKADEGSRHDAMTARVHHLVQLASSGHTGAGAAFLELRASWAQLTAGEDREDELERALLTSARKAVTAHGAVQVPNDPCLLVAGGIPLLLYTPPVVTSVIDGETVEEPVQIAEPPRWASVRSVIGAEAFDPKAGLDQTLAEKVLERTYPALRHAYDAGGWLLRLPDRWELHGRLSPWAVAQCATLMPVGDPSAEKGSEQHDRSVRRARLMSTAGARAVAGKMDDLVSGGLHPASVALADLDADPEVLWAGGVPWSLRFSDVVPVPAEHIDPATPHLHAGGVRPERRETPLWDALLTAVWPDPELRSWAIRVLSIALTGYADRALPVLLGETGRGKTQVVALIMSVLGSYAHAANPKLLAPTANEHDTIVFDLKGRRLSFIDEAPSEAKAGQERLKQLTGGGELTGRRMNQDPVTFAPTHTFVLTANDEPTLTDPAVRSRVRLIPCEGDPEAVRQARAAIGHIAGTAWRREAPGVLAALMAEAAAWLADPTTAAVTAAPENVRYLAEHLGAEQDPVSVWVNEETEPFEQGTPSRELYQAFTASCLRNNLRRDAIPSETKWGRALTRLGVPTIHTERGKRRPLKLRSGGFLPGMEPLTGLDRATGQPTRPSDADHGVSPIGGGDPDGLTPNPDGFLTGSDPQPVSANPQVNHSVSVEPDGSDGFEQEVVSHTHTRPRVNSRPEIGSNPSHDPSSEPPRDLFGEPVSTQPGEPLSEPAEPKRRRSSRSAEATRRAAEVKAEKRAAAIAEAAGATVELPALVTRDGSVRTVTLDQADELLETITGERGHGELTIDVEHTGYPIGHQHYALRTIQLGDENLAVVLDHQEAAHNEVAARHLAAARTLHAHSAGADIVPLAVAGLVEAEEAWSRTIDTGVLAKLADPAMTGNNDDLKGAAKAVLGEAALSPAADQARGALFKAGRWLTDVEVTTPPERSGWAQADHRTETMARYDGADVLDCAALARRLPMPAPGQLHREKTAQRMTARVAHTGFRFVPEQIDRLHDQHSAERAQLAEAIPVDNPGSNDQIGAALASIGAQLPRTGTGKPSVAKGVLEPLAGARDADGSWATDAADPVQQLARLVLDWRHHDTALKLFLDPWRDMVRNGDGRARSTVHTLGADTGRMSSVRFNLQQITREGGMRACISADPGYLLITADFASVEIRVAAALSQDQALIQMLLDEVDLHGEIAKLVWGPGFTKSNRYMAKRKVFGRIYGQGLDGMAHTDGAGVHVARRVIDAMDAMTPGLSAWSADVRGAVEAGRTQYPTYAGRVVHLPKKAPHAGPNYAIQGTARELLIDALMRWDKTRWGHCTLMPVHDEILVMVPEGEATEATAALEAAMATELYGVPIVAKADEPSFFWRDSA
ncbi:MAG: DNA polymerase [Nocardioides sp.]|uniref:DNA polymerase n=1 Tax=Nocardioides sp. TaxID=35761 RepID=UPI0039E28E5D